MIPRWVGTSASRTQSRPRPPAKLPQRQPLRVVAPVPKPTFCTPRLFMGPPVTFQPGEWDKGTELGCSRLGSLGPVLTPLLTSGTPASLRLQTRGVRPPTQLRSWSCSLGQGAQDTQQLHPRHPLPRTSSRGVRSPLPTPALGLTWMWAPNQCTELSRGPSASLPVFHHRPPLPFPQACSPITSTGPIPHTKWLPGASPTPLHTLISLPPTPASKLWLSCWESSWGQLPLPGSHLGVNGGRLCLAKWGRCPALPPPGPHPWAPQVVPPHPSASHTSLFSGPEYFC